MRGTGAPASCQTTRGPAPLSGPAPPGGLGSVFQRIHAKRKLLHRGHERGRSKTPRKPAPLSGPALPGWLSIAHREGDCTGSSVFDQAQLGRLPTHLTLAGHLSGGGEPPPPAPVCSSTRLVHLSVVTLIRTDTIHVHMCKCESESERSQEVEKGKSSGRSSWSDSSICPLQAVNAEVLVKLR